MVKASSSSSAEKSALPFYFRKTLSETFSATENVLIADSKELVSDPILLSRELANALSAPQENNPSKETDLRRYFSTRLSAFNSDARAAIAGAFLAAPLYSRSAKHSYAWLTDLLLRLAKNAAEHLHPMPSAGQLTIIGVGGYGRGEMAPFSDVDLLFLLPRENRHIAQKQVETILYILWDLKLKLGHSTRSIRECITLSQQDHTIRTSLLECRLIHGDQARFSKLRRRLRKELFDITTSQFIEAKLSERKARHIRQGGNRYRLEPNVKEAKGGLRDLQSLYWMAKYLTGTSDSSGLLDSGLFEEPEYKRFIDAENFLWAVRCHLHLLAGRSNDRLSFDRQIEVAERMGYVDGKGRRGVEHFMQDYFRHATGTGDLTRIFVTALEARHVTKHPELSSLLKRRKKLPKGFGVQHRRLIVQNPDEYFKDGSSLMRVFREALRTELLIHPDTMREINYRRDLIDEATRKDPATARIFFDCLLKYNNPERALRRMHELSILAAYIPEFFPITAMMQFNMYHQYTVDEHIIQCISELSKIERGELTEELPICSQIIHEVLSDRKILYVALLLHDIGKGQEEDHSILGARIARVVAPRMGLKQEEVATVEWLVRHHLRMSDVAQKRDLSDERTIRDFAKFVRTKRRLNLLMLLTTCDIRGVGPGTWNNWKARLLRTLYSETANALENGLEEINRETQEREAKQAVRDKLKSWPEKALRFELKRHYSSYWQGLPTETHLVFAKLLRDLNSNALALDLQPDPDRDATRIAFTTADHPGIFSRMAGALALSSANVVDARTYTSRDGFATAAFWVQDQNGHPYARERLPRLRKAIEQALTLEKISQQALSDRDKINRRERGFRVPTNITFDNDGSELHTIIEVDTRDRPGLLFDLTRVLANANVNIVSAVIATYGEQVVDSFYVKDIFGLKYWESSRQRSLEEKLRQAISLGVERALK